jgi:hypothetical protein
LYVAGKKKYLVGRKAHQHEPRPRKKKKIQRRIEGEEKTIIQLVLNFNRVVVVAAALASASCGLQPIKIHTRPEDKKMNLVKRKKEKTVQRIKKNRGKNTQKTKDNKTIARDGQRARAFKSRVNLFI